LRSRCVTRGSEDDPTYFEGEEETKELEEEEGDRDDWIWDHDSTVPVISNEMMPYGVESKEEGPPKVKSLSTQIQMYDQLTMEEKKKALT